MNIFSDSNYASQSSLPTNATFQEITTNGIIISNGTAGDLLFLNTQKAINGLQIGPQKYILQSDGNLPQWSNAIEVNSIKTNQLKIPGTAHGDLFTVDVNNNFERVAISAINGALLMSTGTEFEWLQLSGGKALIEGNSLISVPSQGLFNQLAINVGLIFSTQFSYTSNCTSGKNYKITFSCNIKQTSMPQEYYEYQLLRDVNVICSGQVFSDSDINRTFIHNAVGNDVFNFQIKASTTGSCIVSGFNLIIERYA